MLVPVMLATPFATQWLWDRIPPEEVDEDAADYACPECHHDEGSNDGHCANIEQVGGWTQDQCSCRNNWHRRYADV